MKILSKDNLWSKNVSIKGLLLCLFNLVSIKHFYFSWTYDTFKNLHALRKDLLIEVVPILGALFTHKNLPKRKKYIMKLIIHLKPFSPKFIRATSSFLCIAIQENCMDTLRPATSIGKHLIYSSFCIKVFILPDK